MLSAGPITRGASFDELARVMRPQLKNVPRDVGMRATMVRLLRELEAGGVIAVGFDDRYRLADDLDPELRDALVYLATFAPSANGHAHAA